MEQSEYETAKINIPTILFHGIQNCLSLETCRLESRTSDMSSLSVLCYPEYSTLGIIDPVWSKETTKGSNEYASAIVRNGGSEIRYFMAVRDESQIVHQEFDTASRNSDAAFEGIDGLSILAELICNCR